MGSHLVLMVQFTRDHVVSHVRAVDVTGASHVAGGSVSRRSMRKERKRK